MKKIEKYDKIPNREKLSILKMIKRDVRLRQNRI